MTEMCENTESITCGRCKAQLPPGMTKCPCCGWRSEEFAAKTAEVKSEIPEDSNICGRCKAQLPPEMDRCPCCGWKVPSPEEEKQEYDTTKSITCERCKVQLPPGVVICPCCAWKATSGEKGPKKSVFLATFVFAVIAFFALLGLWFFLNLLSSCFR